MEEDIIGKHMWPLTAPLPYYKESYMVSLADKICAVCETLSIPCCAASVNQVLAAV